MKRVATLLILAALLSACTSRTEFGACVGLGDDKKPDLTYKVSGWNVAMAILFVEMIVPPVFVVADQLYCPVGKK